MAGGHSATLGLGQFALTRAASAQIPGDSPCCDGDVHRLGEQLLRCSERLAPEVAVADGEHDEPAAELREAFSRLAAAWTASLAGAILGDRETATRESELECIRSFDELAGRRLAPVDQIVRFCLRWRDGAGEVVASYARELGLDASALVQVNAMLQRSLDATVLRLCEAFEAERRESDERLRFLATHDVVTGLPNRTLLSERLATMLDRSYRDRAYVALLFIDVDNFKIVNDTLGHQAGDELLCGVTGRLREVVRDPDELGRFGGDEFVVIVDQLPSGEVVEAIAQRVLDAFDEPFLLLSGSASLGVTASVGVALAKRATVQAMLRDADRAMYRAKRAGKNAFAVISTRAEWV